MNTNKPKQERINNDGKDCKDFHDHRKPSQIQISKRLVRTLSAINFERLDSYESKGKERKSVIKKQDILYVCLSGIPPLKDQFANLNLPGQILQIQYLPYSKPFTLEQIKQYACTFQQSADIMHTKINQISTKKPIVFVYHSFGTFTLSVYLDKYPSERIIGMIDIVGVPIRMYQYVQFFYQFIQKYTMRQIQQNTAELYEEYLKRTNRFKAFPSIATFYGYSKAFKYQQQKGTIFNSLRNWPKIVKCFINGNRDYIFSQQLKAEKIIYYVYENKFSKQYNEKLRKTWALKYGEGSQNVQENFVYQIDGAHSVHIQKKHAIKLQKIILHYLQFLEDLHSVQSAKL